MKKRLLSFAMITAFAFTMHAQTITDTVSIGTGYTDQVWYNLDSGTETSVNGSSWDLGFQINGFSAAILANTAYGAEVYKYPNGDTGNWTNLDTAGINSWTPWHNPSTTWGQGAFNMGKDASNFSDLGWGNYNFITHHVIADSLFVWKTATGVIYKVWIQSLISGSYNFLVADYNGTNVNTVALAKSNFSGKNFGYYSIAQDSVLDLEPASNSWELTFSKYIEDLGIPYSVSGIRINAGIEAVQVYPINNTTTYDSAAIHTYSSEINTIGHDWKRYNFGTSSYDIEDSTVYFVKIDSVTYWKLVMKGFGGYSNGNFIFEKTKINTITGLFEDKTKQNGSFMVYPNPSLDRNISLVADLPESIKAVQLNVLNISGQLVKSEQLQINNSFDVLSIQLDNLKSGMYFLQLNHESGSISRRLILK
ncbi:MAG: T9SS type A sorting domain-containing protein [Flavobacteriales bacterium]|nr:T9SS type A sorting domain-containing protein [Flavobacteriales bacterium]